DPQRGAIYHDRAVGGLGESHRKAIGAALVERTARFALLDQWVVDPLAKVGLEAAQRLVGTRGALHDRVGGVAARCLGSRRHRARERYRGSQQQRTAHSHQVTAGAGEETVRPITSAIALTSRIIRSNCSGNSDWPPSESARSGFGCTSTSRPSAPAAIAARALGGTISR